RVCRRRRTPSARALLPLPAVAPAWRCVACVWLGYMLSARYNPSSMRKEKSMKILLDTDIGGDLDDALALAYLLKQPQCELLGITTVGGESDKRAALASALCHAAGRVEVPIHVGAAAPLRVPERQPHAYQSAALTDQWPHQTFDKRNTALAFL